MCPQRQLVHRKRHRTEKTADRNGKRSGNTLNGRWGPTMNNPLKMFTIMHSAGNGNTKLIQAHTVPENKIPYLIIFFINLYIFTCSCETWLFLLGKIKAKTNQWHGLQKHQWLLQGLRSEVFTYITNGNYVPSQVPFLKHAKCVCACARSEGRASILNSIVLDYSINSDQIKKLSLKVES